MQQHVKAACVLRKSNSGADDTISIAVRTAKDADGHPVRGPVTVYADGVEVAEVDWVAESPPPAQLYRTIAHAGVVNLLPRKYSARALGGTKAPCESARSTRGANARARAARPACCSAAVAPIDEPTTSTRPAY